MPHSARSTCEVRTLSDPGEHPVRTLEPELGTLPGGWSRRRDLNPQPTHYECVALPVELRRLGSAYYSMAFRLRRERRIADFRLPIFDLGARSRNTEYGNKLRSSIADFRFSIGGMFVEEIASSSRFPNLKSQIANLKSPPGIQPPRLTPTGDSPIMTRLV